MKYVSTLISTITVSLLFLGCGSTTEPVAPPGSLEVTWQLGGSTCTKSDVQTVRIMLFDAQTSSIIYDQAQVACQLGSHTFRNLPAAQYHVVVEGYRPETQVAWYKGESELPVDVLAGTVSLTETINLSQNPGWLELSWVFEPNSLCGAAGVNTVDISIWNGFSELVYSGAFPCDPIYAREKAIAEAGPVDTNVFSGTGVPVVGIHAGTYTVDAFAYYIDPVTNQSSARRWWAQEEGAIVEVGTGTPIQLRLQSCEGVSFCQ